MIWRKGSPGFRRRGRVGAWPLLASLLLVVLAGIGGVLWFMREAMRNERMAVRQRWSDVYRGHLLLTRERVAEGWRESLARLDSGEPGPPWFARCVQEGWAESVICLDGEGRPLYPASSLEASAAADPREAAEARALVEKGEREQAIQWLLARAEASAGTGRSVAANAELFALELMGGPAHPRFSATAERLARRLHTYEEAGMPSAQRRFLARELMQLAPGVVDASLLRAEELAAAFLEATPRLDARPVLRATSRQEVWQSGSPSGRVLALFSMSGVQERLEAILRTQPGGEGIAVAIRPPSDTLVHGPKTLIALPVGDALPGWTLALSLTDEAALQTAADRKTTAYLWIGILAVTAMALLAAWIARAFGRQVQLAQLKNDLVATVSHELKTPLTSMRVLVDTLLESDRLEEKTTREYLHLLAQENARLSRLIENVLTFSRLERNKQTFDFAPLAPETVVASALASMHERRRQPGCHLETQSGPDLPSIQGDLDALVTALLNLLDNAWKYTDDEKRILLRTAANNGHVEFAVTDNGCGLAPRETRRIFERFYRVDQRLSRTTEGCGLGLSIVREIIAAHGGQVEVSSEIGRGSTFTIKIPTLR